MNFNQTTRFIIYLLAKPGRALKGIYFFDISCGPAIASFDIVEIAPTPIGQILPGTKLPLVLPTLSLFSSWCFHNIGLKVIIKAQHALPLQTSDLGLRSDDGNVKSGSHHSPQGRSTLRPYRASTRVSPTFIARLPSQGRSAAAPLRFANWMQQRCAYFPLTAQGQAQGLPLRLSFLFSRRPQGHSL